MNGSASKPPPPAAQSRTPSEKRFFFLTYFLPFLIQNLARVFMEDTISSAVGFTDRTLAKTVLENIPTDPKSPVTPIDVLMDVLQADSESETWTGYIAPASTDSYIFIIAQDEQPPPFTLDGVLMTFTKQQEDPQRVWVTKPTASRLNSGKLYSLEIPAASLPFLEWKPSTGIRSKIPTSSFLPRAAEHKLSRVFVNLQQLAVVTNHLKLSSEELIYMNDHRSDFNDIEFSAIKVSQWKRLETFVVFRSSLPAKTDISLIEFFTWAVNSSEQQKDSPTFQSDLTKKISQATGWDELQVLQVLQNTNLTTGNANEFRNEILLVRFQEIITLANQIGVAIPRLFSWAKPLGTNAEDFFKLHDVAEDIQRVVRSRYNLSTWPDVVRPLNDVLRENQKTALVSHLLVQDQIRWLGISDADGLFEFFLIDVQMGPLVETSRIKQAIATVQIYVQRCLLGLEDSYGVVPSALDRNAWEWMQRYRVWEANRKVFLYPENWIEPSLRDDKSNLFKALESELLQKDLSDEVVSSALKNFLYNVSEFSNMMAVGICVDTDGADGKIHLFSRTRAAPYSYYYISYANKNWTPWVKMEIEIPHYTAADSSGHNAATGAYLYPVVFKNRLIVFIPQIMKKTFTPLNDQKLTDLGGAHVSELAPKDAWEIKLSWTEFRNGAWTARKLCPDGYIDDGTAAIDRYMFFTTDKTSDTVKIWFTVLKGESQGALGGWGFGDNQLSLLSIKQEGSVLPGQVSAMKVKWTDKSDANSYTTFGYTISPSRQLSSTESKVTSETTLQDSISRNGTNNSPYVEESTATINFAPTVKLISGDTQKLYNTAISSLMPVASPVGTDDMALFKTLGGVAATDADMAEAFGLSPDDGSFNERGRPYSIYNWELGLHAPMILVDRLLKAQQFEKALDVCHYVFNPMAKGDKKDMSRFWTFVPFKKIKTQTVESLFMNLRAGMSE